MKKSDLKSRMVVELRNGSRRMVVIDEEGRLLFLGKDDHVTDYLMKEDMTCDKTISNIADIMKVFESVFSLDDVDKTQKLIWERKEYYNGKIICYEENGSSFFTKGKVYEVKDGAIFADLGVKIRAYKTLDEINVFLMSDFIEYKG